MILAPNLSSSCTHPPSQFWMQIHDIFCAILLQIRTDLGTDLPLPLFSMRESNVTWGLFFIHLPGSNSLLAEIRVVRMHTRIPTGRKTQSSFI